MTTQEFIDLYGKSVYQVRLEVASQIFCRDSALDPDWCLNNVDRFIEALLLENLKELRQLYD
jgi:hypothetical protein